MKCDRLEATTCYEFEHNENLFLLPGHIEFSEYDATYNIAENMTGSLVVLQNVPGALRQLITMTSENISLDFVLLDMSPSISATNANILMGSDFFYYSMCPRLFLLYGHRITY